MKKLVTLLSAALVAAACTSTPGARQLSEWEMQQAGGSKTYSVTVPTTVAGALHRAGELGENPLEQLNLFELDQTRFDSTWVFTTRFKAGKGHNILRMGGLGYSADILVNGTLLASADTTLGVLSVREWDITPLLKKDNCLEVRTHKAPRGSLNHGFVDWNPFALDDFMGILAPVTLICTPDVQVQDVFVPLRGPVEGLHRGVYHFGEPQ